MQELLSFAGKVAGDVRYLDNFEIPQLSRKRKIWVYLPQNYHDREDKYPVLYMHDGQNLFAEEISYSGEWMVDDTLEHLAADKKDRGVIVVGIESGKYRNTEMVPGCPDCDSYVDFIVKTLKPYVDEHFRVIPWREQTGIMGSSFGGQTSIYASLRYPEIFGLVGAFSPSLFLDAHTVAAFPPLYRTRYYICAGEHEAADCVPEIAARFTPNVREVAEALKKYGQETNVCIDADGFHNEKYWAKKFPEAYEWLYGGAW